MALIVSNVSGSLDLSSYRQSSYYFTSSRNHNRILAKFNCQSFHHCPIVRRVPTRLRAGSSGGRCNHNARRALMRKNDKIGNSGVLQSFYCRGFWRWWCSLSAIYSKNSSIRYLQALSLGEGATRIEKKIDKDAGGQ